MRWQDIETRYPEKGGETIAALETWWTRRALGFDVYPRDVKAELRAAYDAWARTGPSKWDQAMNGRYALVAAVENEWDVVGNCTGGPLANRVVIKKTYGDNTCGLARHLATIVRGRLPGTHALAAMEDVRARLAADQPPDPSALVIAAHVFARDIARADDAVAATRAWLDGATLELDDARPIAAPADGEDPRVKIFERYVAELSEDVTIAAELATRAQGDPWSRDVEHSRRTLDDLVIRAYVARLPLPPRWHELVDPIVGAWLDGDPAGVEARCRDLALLRPAGAIRNEWEDALWAIVSGTPIGFATLVEQGKLKPFKPGQLCKDDARKLVRYIGAAIGARASADDVMPAWLDFLARRSPATTPRIASERSPLRWKHLLMIQAAITHRIGGRDMSEVGRALQATISGA